MPRQPKPFYRAQTKSWYCSIGGKQISLGKSKPEADRRFHELMVRREDIQTEHSTVYELSQTYLDWCQKHRASGTYENQRRILRGFVASVGKQLRIAQVRQHHLTKWLEEKSLASTTMNDRVSVVVRLFNWAIEEGYLFRSPIPRTKKPPRRRREVFYTSEQWKQIMRHARGPLADFLEFLWITGCRPQEARTLEARHLHGDLVIFPASEAKGEKHDRVIFLTEQAKSLVQRLVGKYPTGPLFRNADGAAWTKDAIKCRLTRISKQVGFRVIAYGVRHAYATNALLNGVDPVSVSHLMGHRSPAMVTQVYSHLAQNHEFLRNQARNAVRSPSANGAAE